VNEDRDPEDDLLIGQVIGNYRILSSIGRGGMGSVYLATHEVLGRRAAVKVLLPEFTGNAELVTRFFREARATAQLRHRAFVEIFDSGRLGDGSAYLVMEYLRGENLAAYLRRVGALPIDDALAIARDIAEGVGFAHAHGIIHRDLKPDNVFLTVNNVGEPGDPQGGGVAVKILDFGIAKLMGEQDRKETAARTRAGAVLGTPLYMAPEQCRGSGQIDHRADLYSFGCIVHEMLCNLPPFPLEGFGEILAAHLAQPPPALRALRRDVPEAVERLVLSLLSKLAAHRPPDMTTIAAAIDSIRAERGGAGSVARLPVRAPELELEADGPFASPEPSYAPPRSGGSGSPRAPGRTPVPGSLPRTTPAPPPLLRTTPAPPSSLRTTPAPVGEPSAEVSAGGTQLLPDADESPRSRSDRTGGQHPGRPQPNDSMSTLRGPAGEMGHRRVPRAGVGAGRIAAIVAASVGAGAALVIGVVKLTSVPAAPPAEAVERAVVEAPPAPARVEAPRPPPVADPGVAALPPPAASTVAVRIVSDPPGAAVIDTRTGESIGRTPFAGDLPRVAASITLSLRKSGYRSKDVNVSLDHDAEVDVKLDRKPSDNDYRKL
jgi:serine/threonine-protein kinase